MSATADIENIIENWSDDDDEIEKMVLCPPERVDCLTDEEEFEDDLMQRNNIDSIPEVAGFIEIECARDGKLNA